VPKEQKKNGYEDDDFRQVLAEMEEMDEEAKEIMASAAGKVSAIRKRQQNKLKIAKAELNIPSALMRRIIKQRKIERQLQDLADDTPEDEIELYADAAGQFSFLAPEADEPEVVTPAQRAASRAAKVAAENSEAEQAQGAQVLDEMAGAVQH
jgi:hypothetical protein